MIVNGYKNSEVWTNKKGKEFVIIPGLFGTNFYIDEQSQNLNSKYNPHFVIDIGGVEGSDDLILKVAKVFPVMQSFGGLNKQSLDKVTETFNGMTSSNKYVELGLFRDEFVKRQKVFFPTEEFAQAFFNRY